jgi:hypothetical protein
VSFNVLNKIRRLKCRSPMFDPRQDDETVRRETMHDAFKVNRVSSMTALVNSLIQQINDAHPGSTKTASRMLGGGREPDAMPTLVFNWRPLPVASVWSSW